MKAKRTTENNFFLFGRHLAFAGVVCVLSSHMISACAVPIEEEDVFEEKTLPRPGYCNVCRDSPPNQPIRTLDNPNESFTMNGDNWTCGYLQQTVREVNPYNGAPGEARWCALAQIWAENYCTCNGPAIPPTTDNIKDPNPACDICKGQELDHVPAIRAEDTADTGVAGNMNCEGLYHAAAEGVLTSYLCPIVRANAGPICCSYPVLDENEIPGGGGGGGGDPQCAESGELCQSDGECCDGLTCRTKPGYPSYCAAPSKNNKTRLGDERFSHRNRR